MAAKIKRGDKVMVMTGRSKGQTGVVTEVIIKTGRALVEGVNMVTKHQKPSQTAAGGLVQKEASIDLSNLMVLDPSNDKPTRVGFRVEDDGSKVRVAKGSGTVIPEPDWRA